MQHIEDLVQYSDFSKETDLESRLERQLQNAAKKKVSLDKLVEEEGLSSQKTARSNARTRARAKTAGKDLSGPEDPMKAASPLRKN